MRRDMLDEQHDKLESDEAMLHEQLEKFKKSNIVYRFFCICRRKRLTNSRASIEKRRTRNQQDKQNLDDEEHQFWTNLNRNEQNVSSFRPTCPICIYDLRNESHSIFALKCGHMYHIKCIEEYINQEYTDDRGIVNNTRRCTICNAIINREDRGIHLEIIYM